jgi:transposase-like protein
MERDARTPQTLQDAIVYFADAGTAHAFMVTQRWPNGVICPHCAATEPSFLSTRRIWKCRACHKQFSVKVGTIFEDSPIGLDKWLPCVWMLVNCKNGVSSYEIGRALGVTQKTAWFMLHRIRLAMQDKLPGMMGGDVEADETFIGGKSRFMHKGRRARVITGTGGAGKVAVMGLLERDARKAHSRVHVQVVRNTRKPNLQAKVRENVAPGASLFTDALKSYDGLGQSYVHEVIDHSVCYVRGKVHTNGLENFWSLLKRGIRGTYVSIEPFHLFRYLDEQAHRFNNRKDNDSGRFLGVLRNVIGRRVTYKALTGATLAESC